MSIEKISSKNPPSLKIKTIGSSNYAVGSEKDKMLDKLILENFDKFDGNVFANGKFIPEEEFYALGNTKTGFFKKITDKLFKIFKNK